MQQTSPQIVESMNEVFINLSQELSKAIAQCNYHSEVMDLHWKHFGETPIEMVSENVRLYGIAINLDFRVKTLKRIAHLFHAVADDGRFAQSFPEVENVDDMIRHFMR
jgi:hypothetical protein